MAKKLLLGVIHLLPLPGSPRWGGDFGQVLKRAVADAKAYEAGGADQVIIENFGDLPFTKDAVPPETVAGMAVAAAKIKESVRLPFGFNVLRNDARAALGLCAVTGGKFIRVNVHTGAMLTDQGVIEGKAFETLRVKQALRPDIEIYADVHVKHAAPVAPIPIGIAARDTLERGLANALIVSGAGTGEPVSLQKLQEVRLACPNARILIGSGLTFENAAEYLPYVDGAIVGSSLKIGGKLDNPVDPRRVKALRSRLKS